jgi:hypothetical protein
MYAANNIILNCNCMNDFTPQIVRFTDADLRWDDFSKDTENSMHHKPSFTALVAGLWDIFKDELGTSTTTGMGK